MVLMTHRLLIRVIDLFCRLSWLASSVTTRAPSGLRGLPSFLNGVPSEHTPRRAFT